MMGFTQVFDFQGIDQWIYGRILNPSLHHETAISEPDWESAGHLFQNLMINLTGTALTMTNIPGVSEYRVYAFDNAEATDPADALAYIVVPAFPFDARQDLGGRPSTATVVAELSEFYPALTDGGTYYLRIRGMVPEYPVVGQDGVVWGEHTPLSRAISTDPFVGADDWARNSDALPAAAEQGLLHTRMIGNWTANPNRLQAASDIVRFAQALTGISDLDELSEYMGLEEAEAFADTENANALFLRAAGVSEGVGNNYFGAEQNFTRAEMVVMLHRLALALGVDVEGYSLGSESFDDLPDWADVAVGWAAEIGITIGEGERRFNPNGALQNQHVGVFAIRALRYLDILD